jgi:hypothetical protein
MTAWLHKKIRLTALLCAAFFFRQQEQLYCLDGIVKKISILGEWI